MASNLTGLQQIVDAANLYINGMLVANNPTTSTRLFTVTSGICRDQSNTLDINLGNAGGVVTALPADATTLVDVAVVGLNGIDTGAVAANKMYNLYVIADTVGTNPTGCIISLNAPATGPSMPYGYNAYRLIGFIPTNGSSQIISFWSTGLRNTRTFMYDVPVATTITAGTATTITVVTIGNLVPVIDNLSVNVQSIFTPAAASNTLNVGSSNAFGNNSIVYGQVAAVPLATVTTVVAKLSTGLPAISYKVSAGAVALNISGFTYSI